jgi:hypothetical protein
MSTPGTTLNLEFYSPETLRTLLQDLQHQQRTYDDAEAQRDILREITAIRAILERKD